jgi:hypothetical protein
VIVEITAIGAAGARREFRTRIPNEPSPRESSDTTDVYLLEDVLSDRYSFYADVLVKVGHDLGVSVGVKARDI